MKNCTLLSIAIIISLVETQCMPMAAVKSFFSKHTPTYEQIITVIREASAAFANTACKHKALTALALCSTAIAMPPVRKTLTKGFLHIANALRIRVLNRDLHAAVRGSNCKAVNRLLAAGANPNAQAEDGLTPLHIAVIIGNFDIVNRLHLSCDL